MSILHNMRMISSDVRKNKGTTECDKRPVTSDVGTLQYEDDSIKWEKKIREPHNVTKVQSHVISVLRNVRTVPSNMRKNKGTIEFDKSIVKYDCSTA